MDIKEIAQALKLKMQDPDDGRFDIGEFAEALIAEIAKGNEPVAYLTRNEDGDPAMLFFHLAEACNYSGDDYPEPLYAFPPTAEQIANETAWQPIETAPKDEDLIVTDGNNVALGRWVGRYFAWGYGADPTHWMPLPEAPKGERP